MEETIIEPEKEQAPEGKKKGRKFLPIFLILGILLSFPISLVALGFGLPPQFGETYYGELPIMKKKLYESKRKKIVFLGNSSVAFGIRTDLIQQELPDYDVVNFGLYGTIGTKTMLDWSKKAVKEGDIMVVLPEPYPQTSSLYFSAKDVWRAADGDYSLLQGLSKKERQNLVGSFFSYVGEKFEFMMGKNKISTDGPYSKKAFLKEDGSYADYLTYDRPYNVMMGGYDQANPISYSIDVYGPGFLTYLDDYASFCKEKGAKAYLGFCPVDSLSLSGDPGIASDSLYDSLSKKVSLPLLGHPEKSILDYRYFYDNNVHLNSSGAYVYTNLLCEDLKLTLGIYEPNSIPIPEPPEIPEEEYEEGDNVDESYFLYQKKETPAGDYYSITSLTEEGKKMASLTIPSSHEGLPVREFGASTFAGNKTIARIVIPSSIKTIYDYSFDGCDKLVALVFRHDSILGLNVGNDFLVGAPNCLIYLKKGVNVADCAGGWERYLGRIRYY